MQQCGSRARACGARGDLACDSIWWKMLIGWLLSSVSLVNSVPSACGATQTKRSKCDVTLSDGPLVFQFSALVLLNTGTGRCAPAVDRRVHLLPVRSSLTIDRHDEACTRDRRHTAGRAPNHKTAGRARHGRALAALSRSALRRSRRRDGRGSRRGQTWGGTRLTCCLLTYWT